MLQPLRDPSWICYDSLQESRRPYEHLEALPPVRLCRNLAMSVVLPSICEIFKLNTEPFPMTSSTSVPVADTAKILVCKIDEKICPAMQLNSTFPTIGCDEHYSIEQTEPRKYSSVLTGITSAPSASRYHGKSFCTSSSYELYNNYDLLSMPIRGATALSLQSVVSIRHTELALPPPLKSEKLHDSACLLPQMSLSVSAKGRPQLASYVASLLQSLDAGQRATGAPANVVFYWRAAPTAVPRAVNNFEELAVPMCSDEEGRATRRRRVT